MQAITNGYRGLSLMVQLGADRILVPLAIALSLSLAAGVVHQILNAEPVISPAFF